MFSLLLVVPSNGYEMMLYTIIFLTLFNAAVVTSFVELLIINHWFDI